MPASRVRMLRISVTLLTALVAMSLSTVSTVSSAQDSFDHFTTGFRLQGMHRFADCESCHADGLFAGTPRQCVGCHAQASRVRV